VLGHSLNFMLVQKNDSVDPIVETTNATVLENSFQTVEYQGFDSQIGHSFLIQKKGQITSFNLGLELRYYPSYQGFEGTRSGASVFRPSINESLAYCNETPKQVSYQTSVTVSQIKLLFECLGGSNATVKGKLYFDDPVIEWEVTTDAIWVGDD